MYASGITQELIDKAVAFHGHTCPGISLGIRVAAWAMQHFGTAADEEIVAVTETDMCAVDAIQALVGCTFGKGNLIFRDRGKVAFTFFRRSDNKSARLVQILRHDAISRRSQEIRNALSAEHLSEEDRTRLELERQQLRQKSMEQILSLPFEERPCCGSLAEALNVKKTPVPAPDAAAKKHRGQEAQHCAASLKNSAITKARSAGPAPVCRHRPPESASLRHSPGKRAPGIRP